MADLLNRWLNEYACPNVAAKTYVRYAQIVGNNLIPAPGDRLLERLTPSHVNAYYSQTVSTGNLSKRTIHHHHRVLKQALKWAVRLELTFRNAADSVDPPRPERAEIKTLDANQARNLDALATDAEYGGPILVALHTGMRQAEILGLRWSDLDLQGRRLSV